MSNICLASSLVGTIIKAKTSFYSYFLTCSISLWKIGIKKANVFPDPVAAFNKIIINIKTN